MKQQQQQQPQNEREDEIIPFVPCDENAFNSTLTPQ